GYLAAFGGTAGISQRLPNNGDMSAQPNQTDPDHSWPIGGSGSCAQESGGALCLRSSRWQSSTCSVSSLTNSPASAWIFGSFALATTLCKSASAHSSPASAICSACHGVIR